MSPAPSTGHVPDPDGSASGPPRIVVPADIDTPDTIAWGLTFRQLTILAAPTAAIWTAYTRFGPALPPAAWVAITIVVLAAGVTVALGRRDGLPLDVWVRHGLTLHTTARLTTPGSSTPGAARAGAGAVVVTRPVRPPVPAPLRPQVTSIAADGTVTVAGAPRVLIGCGTTSVALRTPTEQHALLEGFGRWLNALTGPVQILVSTARHDLTGPATALAHAAAGLPHPALRQAANDHARFLLDLDQTREPLHRHVLTVTTPTTTSTSTSASRATSRADAGPPGVGDLTGAGLSRAGVSRVGVQARAAVRALTSLGITATALDGPAAAAALAAAVDPYDPPVPGPRAPSAVPVTTRHHLR